MAMRDKHGVDLPDEVAPVPEQVDARFPGINKKVPSPGKNDRAGEEPVRRGETRSGTQETDGRHALKLRRLTRKASEKTLPTRRESRADEKNNFHL
jgi:hypothetical protein